MGVKTIFITAETEKICLDALMAVKENSHENTSDLLHHIQSLEQVSEDKECITIMEDYAGKERYCLKIDNASKSWKITLVRKDSA